jgi:hypothetical protein
MPSCADPGRAVDAESDVPFARCGGLSRVDAHPHAKLRAVRPGVLGKPALTRDRRSDSILRAPEGDEERVTLRVDFVASVFSKGRSQNGLMIHERHAVAVSSEPFQQLRGSLDVREQEGDGPDRKLTACTHARSLSPNPVEF